MRVVSLETVSNSSKSMRRDALGLVVDSVVVVVVVVVVDVDVAADLPSIALVEAPRRIFRENLSGRKCYK